MYSRRRHRIVAAAIALATCAPALAAPQVTTDIAPVQSIVAAVMAGVGSPDLIVPPGASEHGYALRPSEARALAAADLVVWIGPQLTPWLAGPIAALAGEAPLLTLTDAPGVRLLDVREGGPFEAHDHPTDEDHAGHDHAEAAGADPHVWLDPLNAAAIATAVATELGAIDPANAGAYADNAEAFAAEMAALTAELEARLAPLRDRPFFVFHDAYQYFEARFALPAAGAVALSDAEPPSASRVTEIRDRIAQADIACVFTEPQFEPRLVATLIEGAPTRTGALDPLGAGLDPGPGLYPALLRGLADDLVACLGPQA